MKDSNQLRDWELERFLLKELNRDRLEKLDFDTLQSRLQGLRDSNQQILGRYPKERMAQRILEKAKNSSPRIFRDFSQYRFLSVAASAAVILLAVVTSFQLPKLGGFGQEQILSKGLETYLNVYRKTGSKIEKLKAGGRIQGHDLLQLSYVSTGKRFGCVFSIDSQRHVTIHYPDLEVSKMSGLLESSKEVALPNAYELDQTPGFEKFYFVTSMRPFSVQSIVDQVISSQLGDDFGVYQIELRK